MAETNLNAIARELIEAFNAGDANAFKKHLASNCVYDEIGTQRKFQGPDAWVQCWQQWRESMTDVKGRVTNSFSSGNTVVQEITWEGTHNGNLTLPGNTLPPSGKRQTTRATQILTFDNNSKIKESRHYFDMLHLLYQLGAMPQVRASGR